MQSRPARLIPAIHWSTLQTVGISIAIFLRTIKTWWTLLTSWREKHEDLSTISGTHSLKLSDRQSRHQMRCSNVTSILPSKRGKKHQSYQKSRKHHPIDHPKSSRLHYSTSSRLLFRETRSPFRQAFRARKCRQTQCKCQCIFHTNSGYFEKLLA